MLHVFENGSRSAIDDPPAANAQTKKRPGNVPGPIMRWSAALRSLVSVHVGGIGTVDHLNQRHRSSVALAKAELQDSQVAARARLEARAQLVEELRDDVPIAQPVERETAI